MSLGTSVGVVKEENAFVPACYPEIGRRELTPESYGVIY